MKNTHLLKELIAHMKSNKRGHKYFGFHTYNDCTPNVCGTVGCMAGELPVLYPDKWRFDETGSVMLMMGSLSFTEPDLEFFFDATYEEILHLFYPCGQTPELFGGKMLDEDATLEEVLENAEEFLKRCEA